MRSRILVTGGAGFIGSHLVDQLVEMGNSVVVLDNFSTGKIKNLSDAQKKGEVDVIEGSILDFTAIEQAIQQCDIVYHLAVECVRASLSKPLTNHHTNATGTLNMLEAARVHKIKRFVYCSSSEVYGNSTDILLKENTTVCQPTTVYGAAKLAGEYYTKAYHRTYQLPTVIVRPFNAYGPRAHVCGTRAEVIPRFIIKLLNNLAPTIFGNGKSARDFSYVTEVAHGLYLAGKSDALIGEEVNVAYGQAYSVHEIADILSSLLNKSHLKPQFLASRPGDVHFLQADLKKLKEKLGFVPTIPLIDGLKRYIDWFNLHYPNPELLLEKETINWEMPT